MYLPVLGAQVTHQHVHVVRVPLPVLTAEVLQQTDGFVQTVENTHHSERKHTDTLRTSLKNQSQLRFYDVCVCVLLLLIIKMLYYINFNISINFNIKIHAVLHENIQIHKNIQNTCLFSLVLI